MARNYGDADAVCHAWAHQLSAPHATHSRNLTIEGAVLRSYSTPVAMIVPHKDGGLRGMPSAPRLVLMTRYEYSVTTAKHMGFARRAIGTSLVTAGIVRVASLGLSRADEESNVAEARSVIGHLQAKAKRARARRGEHLFDAQHEIRTINLYLSYCRMQRDDVSADLEESADFASEIAAADLARRAAEEVRAKQRMEAEAERRAGWIAGMMISAPTHGGPFLRVCPSSLEPCLETSRGVRVPLAQAVEVFKIARRCKQRAEPFMPAFGRVRVGDFALDRIDADGTIHAGCHRIAFAEADRLATLIGV